MQIIYCFSWSSLNMNGYKKLLWSVFKVKYKLFWYRYCNKKQVCDIYLPPHLTNSAALLWSQSKINYQMIIYSAFEQ